MCRTTQRNESLPATCHKNLTTRWMLLIVLASTLPACTLRAAEAPLAVSLASLLEEMLDRNAAARLSEPAFLLKQASSHDRRKTDPTNTATWHSNVDYGQFIRTETNEGRQEWVLLEDQGPGAIVRFWTPLLAEKDQQIIRFYFDGSPAPAIVVKLNDLLCGKAFVRPPLAFLAWNELDLTEQLKPNFAARRGVAGDLYLPIPFAKSCKITLDSVPFYYVINYRIYEPGTHVQTFTMAGYEAAKPAVEKTSQALLHVAANPTPAGAMKQARLAPGEELPLDLPGGEAAVLNLRVQIDPTAAPQALRSIILQATFDDAPTVWCPIGEFFGNGVRLLPVEDWWRTVATDGKLTSRWVMPYQRTGRLSLQNVGAAPLAVTLEATTAPRQWNDRSLHFHANWHCQLGMKTRPMVDWNYLDVQGRGRYVGDTLSVFSPVKAWYGEGDERIYYDGEKFPAHLGTGTEDYYGYAWGMAGYFSSPFISMPQRDSRSQDNWRGYTTTSRLRLLDAIPFKTALKHDMEIWNWADAQVDYAVGTFWYARPGAKHNREAQPKEAAAPVREHPGDFRIAGAIECETLPIGARSPGLRIGSQDAGLHAGQWSGEQQLFVQATKVGDFVELEIQAADNRPCKVTLYGTKSYDYGMLRFSVNGNPAGNDFDGYQATPVASGPIELGRCQPQDGKLRLRIEVVGSNSQAKGAKYYFGLDALVLSPP
jgi:Protein of unknown function (DUF2961)